MLRLPKLFMSLKLVFKCLKYIAHAQFLVHSEKVMSFLTMDVVLKIGFLWYFVVLFTFVIPQDTDGKLQLYVHIIAEQ